MEFLVDVIEKLESVYCGLISIEDSENIKMVGEKEILLDVLLYLYKERNLGDGD